VGRIIQMPLEDFLALNVAMPDSSCVYELINKNHPLIKQYRQEQSAQNPWAEKFSEIWKLYPRKLGSKGALKAFLASVKTEQDWQDINAALCNYKKAMPDDMQYVKHGDTWFRNWQDYVTPVTETRQTTFVKSL
jgi:hypothetical protein